MNDKIQENAQKTVLIVDDDASFVRVLGRALAQYDYAVWPTETMADATAAIDAVKPDYAVIDLHLDDGSGLDLLEHMRASSPATRSVVLSGYIDTSTAVAAMRLGAIDCLIKPVDIADLVGTLQTGGSARHVLPERIIEPAEVRLQHVLARWEKNDRNTMQTAKALGMHRRTLQRILGRAGIGREDRNDTKAPSDFAKLRRLYRVWSRSVA